MNAKGRLKKLEQANCDHFSDVLSWIRAGRYYDELDPEQQQRYCLYFYEMEEPPEQYICNMMGEPERFNAHFLLERRPPPMTKVEEQAQIRKAIAEVECYMNARIEEYNSPEAIAERQRRYEELQEIGRKRREAVEAGLPMDTYPLPWQK